MAGITLSGYSSGIDTATIVAQLMSIERRPVAKLEAKNEAYQQQLTVFSDLRSKLAALAATTEGLNAIRDFRQFSATSSDKDDEHFKANVTSAAQAGIHSVKVMKLAQADVEVSQGYAATTSNTATGDFRIRVAGGDWETITVDSSNNTLEGLRDAINNADLGVTATLMNIGGSSPYALMVTGAETGAAQTVEVDTSAMGGADPVPTFSQTQAADDAQVIFDGVTVNSATNEIDGLISGVSLDLNKADTANTYSLKIESDLAGIEEDITAFVEKYNETLTYLKEKLADKDVANSTLRQIYNELRRSVSTSVSSSGEYRTMAQIGISTSANGQLEIDSDELSDALEDNFDDVLKLMTAYGEPSHANVRFFTSSAETEDGTYAVEITGVGGSFGGTIGGYAAYVQGSNMLVGASGTPVEGLTVMFTGDSAGSYGTVSFTAGFMEKIDRLVDGYLNSSTGLIKSKENSIDRQIRYNESVIERKEKVLDRVEQRLMEQFTKMESALARMQSQSSMLTSLSLFQ